MDWYASSDLPPGLDTTHSHHHQQDHHDMNKTHEQQSGPSSMPPPHTAWQHHAPLSPDHSPQATTSQGPLPLPSKYHRPPVQHPKVTSPLTPKSPFEVKAVVDSPAQLSSPAGQETVEEEEEEIATRRKKVMEGGSTFDGDAENAIQVDNETKKLADLGLDDDGREASPWMSTTATRSSINPTRSQSPEEQDHGTPTRSSSPSSDKTTISPSSDLPTSPDRNHNTTKPTTTSQPLTPRRSQTAPASSTLSSSKSLPLPLSLSILTTPYTTSLIQAFVPVGHHTGLPSRHVVHAHTARSSPTQTSPGLGFGLGSELVQDGVRSRVTTAGSMGSVGSGDGGVTLEGLGFGVGGVANGWRSKSETDLAGFGFGAQNTIAMMRQASSHGYKRRPRLKKVSELTDWDDPGFKDPSSGSPCSSSDSWATAPSTPSGSGGGSAGSGANGGKAADDSWTTISTGSRWGTDDWKKYDERFGADGKARKEISLQAAIDSLHPEFNDDGIDEEEDFPEYQDCFEEDGGREPDSAWSDGPDGGAQAQGKDQAGQGQGLAFGAAGDSGLGVSLGEIEHVEYAPHGQWQGAAGTQERETVVYSSPLPDSPDTPTRRARQVSGAGAGTQVIGSPAQTLATVILKNGGSGPQSPAPPSSPQLKNSPPDDWGSGALGLDVQQVQIQHEEYYLPGSVDYNQVPLPPILPPTLGKLSPYRHIIHLASKRLDVAPAYLTEHAIFPKLARLCGIEIHLAKTMFASELEYGQLYSGHYTLHEVYTWYKQTFRNKEATSGTFQGFVLALIQVAADRPMGENAAETLQSLMAATVPVCLFTPGHCPEHPLPQLPVEEPEMAPTPQSPTEQSPGPEEKRSWGGRVLVLPEVGGEIEESESMEEDPQPMTMENDDKVEDPPEPAETSPACPDSDSEETPTLEPCSSTSPAEDIMETAQSPPESAGSSPPDYNRLDKGKAKEVVETDEAEDMDLDEPDIAVEQEEVHGHPEDLPDLIIDPMPDLHISDTMYSVFPRIIGLLSNRAQVPPEHVLDIDEVEDALKVMGMTPEIFVEVMNEARERDEKEALLHTSLRWYNWGNERGFWRGCRYKHAMEAIAHELSPDEPYPIWLKVLVALMQVYHGWYPGEKIDWFWRKLEHDTSHYDHTPFFPATPSTVVTSPPTSFEEMASSRVEPGIVNVDTQEELDEFRRRERLQIGPSTKQWGRTRR